MAIIPNHNLFWTRLVCQSFVTLCPSEVPQQSMCFLPAELECTSALTSSVDFTDLFFVTFSSGAFTEVFTSVYEEVLAQSWLEKGNE